MKSTPALPLVAMLAFALSGGAAAQETRTTADPEIDTTVLGLMLRPMPSAQLEAEVEAWRALVQRKAEEISEKQLATRSAEADEKSTLIEETAALGRERDALIERATLVVAAHRDKGGDVAATEKYLGAVRGGLDVDVTDARAVWTHVVDWVKSPEGGLRWLKNIVLFILTIVAFKFLAGVAGRILVRALSTFGKTSDLLRNFFVNAARKIIMFVGVVLALSILGIDIGPFLAAMGAAGFIIGFALQGTLSNFAAGIMILMYRPYDVGHFVDVAGETGTVTAMTLVSTTITKPDNQTVVVPNNAIWGGVITNVTGSTTRRVDLMFGIGYEVDLAKAQTILEQVVAAHPLVLAEPAPVIRVHELADSSVNFVVRPWSKTSDYWEVYWDLTRSVKEHFDAEGISIPYPQRHVHVHKAAAE